MQYGFLQYALCHIQSLVWTGHLSDGQILFIELFGKPHYLIQVKFWFRKKPPNRHFMPCPPTIINDSAFTFSAIFCIKILFSNLQSPFSPIFQNIDVRIFIDRIKVGYLYWILRGRKFSPGAQAFVIRTILLFLQKLIV